MPEELNDETASEKKQAGKRINDPALIRLANLLEAIDGIAGDEQMAALTYAVGRLGYTLTPVKEKT